MSNQLETPDQYYLSIVTIVTLATTPRPTTVRPKPSYTQPLTTRQRQHELTVVLVVYSYPKQDIDWKSRILVDGT